MLPWGTLHVFMRKNNLFESTWKLLSRYLQINKRLNNEVLILYSLDFLAFEEQVMRHEYKSVTHIKQIINSRCWYSFTYIFDYLFLALYENCQWSLFILLESKLFRLYCIVFGSKNKQHCFHSLLGSIYIPIILLYVGTYVFWIHTL